MNPMFGRTKGDPMSSVDKNVQSQSQQQTISISVQSAGDPDLERHIFSEVHSAGRQLRSLSAVVELLLAGRENDPPFITPEARKTVDAFRDIQHDILLAKSLRNPDKLMSQLENLRKADPNGFDLVRDRLSKWLAKTSG
jgi:hypothetical protein